ncbi:hypothetical protein LJR225_000627 [Phenylobacterium sp. LjRoot225]|uniref:hypothetical protein n=1 Tax=Phenylobacterium sp. LjRoot225 TaxID=3342285 RepID=UPI003ED00A87
MTKGELRAEEYRARAREALAFAEDASLDRVREQRQRAAATWVEMAEAEEAREKSRQSAPPGAPLAAPPETLPPETA